MVTIKFEFGSIAEAAAFMVQHTADGMPVVKESNVPLPVATITVMPTPTEAPKEKKPKATPAPTEAPTPAPTPAPAASSPTTAEPSDAPKQSALDYAEDVKPAFLRLMSAKGREAAVALVKGFGFKQNLQEAKPEQYAEIVATIEAAING